MGKRKRSKKNKALRKEKNIMREKARLARKALREEVEPTPLQQLPKQSSQPSELPQMEVVTQSLSASEWISNDLSIAVTIPLSSPSYRLYSITTTEDEEIGLFGVFHSGYFNYVVLTERQIEKRIVSFIKDYIRKNLHLNPIENPKLYRPRGD